MKEEGLWRRFIHNLLVLWSLWSKWKPIEIGTKWYSFMRFRETIEKSNSFISITIEFYWRHDSAHACEKWKNESPVSDHTGIAHPKKQRISSNNEPKIFLAPLSIWCYSQCQFGKEKKMSPFAWKNAVFITVIVVTVAVTCVRSIFYRLSKQALCIQNSKSYHANTLFIE